MVIVSPGGVSGVALGSGEQTNTWPCACAQQPLHARRRATGAQHSTACSSRVVSLAHRPEDELVGREVDLGASLDIAELNREVQAVVALCPLHGRLRPVVPVGEGRGCERQGPWQRRVQRGQWHEERSSSTFDAAVPHPALGPSRTLAPLSPLPHIHCVCFCVSV